MSYMTEQRERLILAASSASKEWTLNQLAKGNDPTMDDFIAQFPCFDTKALREIAGKEMFLIKNKEALEEVNEGIG